VANNRIKRFFLKAVTRLRGKLLRRACRTLAEEGLRLDAENASWDAKLALWLLERTAKKPKETLLPSAMAYIDALHTGTAPLFTEDGLITDQRLLPEVRFGRAGNTADHGCGWIAAYNARRLLGEQIEPEDILRTVWRGARFGGRMGTDPFYLIGYFRALGYEAKLVSGMERMEAAAREARAFILLYIFDQHDCPGGHFIAGQYCAETDDLRLLNGDHGDEHVPAIEGAVRGHVLLRLLIALDGTLG